MHGASKKQSAKPVTDNSIGKVVSDYITHKQLAASLGVITEQQFQQTCAALNLAVKFANGSHALLSNVGGSLWKEYDAWRRSQTVISEQVLEKEHQEITEFFAFAERQDITTPANRPCFHKEATETSELIRWIDEQQVKWAAFTLKFPRFHNRAIWERAAKDFFIELERKYPKSTVKKHRTESEAPWLKRIAFIGGDKKSGVALHIHGLVEIQERGVERLAADMQKIWQSAVVQHKDSFIRTEEERQDYSAWLPDAKVWVEELELDSGSSAAAYLLYMARKEQFDFGIGASKVVLTATSL